MALGVELLADVLTAPALRPARGRGRAAGDPRGAPHEPRRARGPRAHRAVARRCSPTTRSGREVLGEMPTVEAMTRDDIAAFFDALVPARRPSWSPPPAARPRRGRRRRRSAASAAATGGELPERRPPAAPAEPRGRRARRHRAGPPRLGWRSLANHDDDRCALAVANQVLGGGMSSRLFQEIREERGLAYSVYSPPRPSPTRATSRSTAAPRPKRAREVLAVIDDVRRRAARRRDHRARARGRRRLPRGLAAARPRGQRQPHGPPRPQPDAARPRSPRSTSTSQRLRAVTIDDVAPRAAPRPRHARAPSRPSARFNADELSVA